MPGVPRPTRSTARRSAVAAWLMVACLLPLGFAGGTGRVAPTRQPDVRQGIYFGNMGCTVITYEVVDGWAVAEGDMVLGLAAEMRSPPCPQLAGGDPERRRWPDGVIPYAVSVADPVMRGAIDQAIQHWHERTPVRFVPRRGDAHFVEFVETGAGFSCLSAVGRLEGRQPILLDANCGFGQIVHEMGHTAGLWHEQGRSDRDCFVAIDRSAIDPRRADQFDQALSDGDAIGFYDYDSIMHYDEGQAGLPGAGPTITTRHGEPVGQRAGLSLGDARAVWAMYGAPDGQLVSMVRTFCPPPASWWEPGWTTFVPFAIDGWRRHLLLYDGRSGALAIRLFAEEGAPETVHQDTRPGGWSFAAFALDGQPYLFGYHPGDGAVAVERIDPDGVPRVVHRDRWSPGWTIVPFRLDDRPHLFEYKPADGTVAVDRIGDDARPAEIYRGRWSPGWRVSAFHIADRPHVVAARSGADTEVAIFRIGDDGAPRELHRTRWTAGWVVTAFEAGPHGLLFEYKPADGTVAVDAVGPNGVPIELFRGRWQTGLAVAALDYGWVSGILAYSPATGEVTIDTPMLYFRRDDAR
jgi:hypothetical protein